MDVLNESESKVFKDFINRLILNPTGVVIKDKQQVDITGHNIFVPIWNHFKEDVDYIFDESMDY